MINRLGKSKKSSGTPDSGDFKKPAGQARQDIRNRKNGRRTSSAVFGPRESAAGRFDEARQIKHNENVLESIRQQLDNKVVEAVI